MTALIISIFVIGYVCITLEHPLRINKAASALLTGVLCWVVYIFYSDDKHLVNEQLVHHLGELSGILFFLMGAMTIVELIDAHDGFEIISRSIRTKDKRKLLWVTSFIAFFLSAVLDNLTTTIVMVSLLRKLISSKQERYFFIGVLVVAANAGGAWSPIGDVTTTMLWIGGQITSGNIIIKLIIPSLVCLLIPLLIISLFFIKGKIGPPPASPSLDKKSTVSARERNLVFFIGVVSLLFVPVFKTVTHLPPFMGILFALGLMWIITEMIHSGKDEVDKGAFSVIYALRKIDVPSILFFLGILISISALQSTGILGELAAWMNEHIGNLNSIAIIIGLLSSIIDNVPLVAAAQGMYTLTQFPTDHYFWEFLAYTAGTGGSCLIIGSAAGVAAMGMEKIEFFWYVKWISWLALIGYFSGALVYILQGMVWH